MLSKILVGVDGSQPSKKALEYASNLASKYGSELYVVNTTEEFGDSVHVQRLEKHDNYVNEEGVVKPCLTNVSPKRKN